MNNLDNAACEDVINSANPFQCFGLTPRRISSEEVRSLYLKIAIKVHPDKNSSDLATQAFQVIKQANVIVIIFMNLTSNVKPFQILSESFDVLHDEEKQRDLLRDSATWNPCGSSTSFHKPKKKKRRKAADIVDQVHQNKGWWEKDWKEVEEEITRMTTDFKDRLAKEQEKHEKKKERNAEKRERKRKKIKRNLAPLYEKYGINPSSSDEEDGGYNYLSYIPQEEQSEDTAPVTAPVIEPPSEPAPQDTQPKEYICYLCERKFGSQSMLKLHNDTSELHKANVAKSNSERENKFKSSFVEVKP